MVNFDCIFNPLVVGLTNWITHCLRSHEKLPQLEDTDTMFATLRDSSTADLSQAQLAASRGPPSATGLTHSNSRRFLKMMSTPGLLIIYFQTANISISDVNLQMRYINLQSIHVTMSCTRVCQKLPQCSLAMCLKLTLDVGSGWCEEVCVWGRRGWEFLESLVGVKWACSHR